MSSSKLNIVLTIAALVLSSHALAHEDTSNLTATYGPSDALDSDIVTEGGELLMDIIPNREIARLHDASGFFTIPTQRHTLPAYYELPAMDNINDFVIKMNEMVTINPAQGEYVTIMEGKRHGFNNTTIGITYTQQGGGAPLHTHETEESHVLVTGGKVRYQLGDDVFVVKGPYIINIPPMVPHAFMNLKKKPIKLVVTFPHNEWEADFVEHINAQEFFTLPNQE
jgi:quercetin dioxygenase-like cupin family protein